MGQQESQKTPRIWKPNLWSQELNTIEANLCLPVPVDVCVGESQFWGCRGLCFNCHCYRLAPPLLSSALNLLCMYRCCVYVHKEQENCCRGDLSSFLGPKRENNEKLEDSEADIDMWTPLLPFKPVLLSVIVLKWYFLCYFLMLLHNLIQSFSKYSFIILVNKNFW